MIYVSPESPYVILMNGESRDPAWVWWTSLSAITRSWTLDSSASQGQNSQNPTGITHPLRQGWFVKFPAAGSTWNLNIQGLPLRLYRQIFKSWLLIGWGLWPGVSQTPATWSTGRVLSNAEISRKLRHGRFFRLPCCFISSLPLPV